MGIGGIYGLAGFTQAGLPIPSIRKKGFEYPKLLDTGTSNGAAIKFRGEGSGPSGKTIPLGAGTSDFTTSSGLLPKRPVSEAFQAV
jgi:hypothetical protein